MAHYACEACGSYLLEHPSNHEFLKCPTCGICISKVGKLSLHITPTIEERMILVIQQLDRLLHLLEDICEELQKRNKK